MVELDLINGIPMTHDNLIHPIFIQVKIDD
jgi:hypothetical protein